MNRRHWAVLTAGLGLVMTAGPALAHHAFSAEYALNMPITLTGSVTKIEWTNPHARFYVDAKGDDGKMVNWNFELGSPNALLRRGWSRNALKIGDTITVSGYLAKDGAHMANARSVVLSDGRKIFAGGYDEGAPPDK